MSASIFRIEAQGVGPIAETFAIPAGEIYRVISVELHLNLASTTALEYFTVTHDSSAGANYDTILYRLDPAVVPTIDLLWQPDGPFYLFGGDALDVAWVNVQGRTWGLHIVMEVMF